jgi:hypothetical protein
VSLPTADDLFRATRHTRDTRHHSAPARERGVAPAEGQSVDAAPADAQTVQAAPVTPAVKAVEDRPEPATRRSSGRVRHDEKMTVYVTADELLDIEHARLSLRRDQGLAVDRGRLVREAIAIVLEDLEENGDDSVLVQRLIGR